jgi:RNase P subunit RPR2
MNDKDIRVVQDIVNESMRTHVSNSHDLKQMECPKCQKKTCGSFSQEIRHTEDKSGRIFLQSKVRCLSCGTKFRAERHDTYDYTEITE